MSATLGGCGVFRPVMTREQLDARARADTAESAASFQASIDRLLDRVEREVQTQGPDATIHFLAISGGGDWGAFGAGFLVGWGQVADPAWRRPDFDTVTGVSTGALLAPFAYLGTDEACLYVEDFYRHPKKDWIQDRGLLFFWPSNASFATIPGLGRDIRRVMDSNFVGRIADESRKGKLLTISATDLDLARQKGWDLGADAEAVGAGRQSLDTFQKKLLASAAIPAVFPPVEINGSLYADGGVTANILLRLDPRGESSFIARWREKHPGQPLPKVRYWIIFNNQQSHIPKTVQQQWPSIIAPSLLTSTRCASLAEMHWLASQADYVNSAYGADIEVRVVAIPNDWEPPVEGSFQKQTMGALADLGRKMGSDPSSWEVWAAPKDSPAGMQLKRPER